jgi:diguanylate cyclase (GGDEF)-like protein
VDYFKNYNDTYGHLVGDQVLRALVQAIQAHVKSSDIIGRWGGEEFAIALPNTTAQHALGIAERIRKTMATVKMRDEHGSDIPSPTVSQGIATFPDHAQETMGLVDIADRALYQAKSLGRDHIVLHKAET